MNHLIPFKIRKTEPTAILQWIIFKEFSSCIWKTMIPKIPTHVEMKLKRCSLQILIRFRRFQKFIYPIAQISMNVNYLLIRTSFSRIWVRYYRLWRKKYFKGPSKILVRIKNLMCPSNSMNLTFVSFALQWRFTKWKNVDGYRKPKLFSRYFCHSHSIYGPCDYPGCGIKNSERPVSEIDFSSLNDLKWPL